jgi:hypothetical protein
VGSCRSDHDDLSQGNLAQVMPGIGNPLVPMAVTWVSIDGRHDQPRYGAEVNVL